MLFDGRHHEEAFEMMQTEAAFPRLVDLIPKCTSGEDGPLQRLMLELMYEMSRIQRLSWDDLSRFEGYSMSPLALYTDLLRSGC